MATHLHASLLLATLALAACGAGPSSAPAASSPPVSAGEPAPPVRNVVLLIGDGMGPGQLALLESWARLSASGRARYQDGPTAIARLAARSHAALSLTHPQGALVVDSACSATQLATGVAAAPEVIGLDSEGNDARTVLETWRDAGRATGLVSDTRLTHATPAAFASHVPHRMHEAQIAEQLVQSGVDVMLSGGLRYFAPRNVADHAEAARAYTEGAYGAASERLDDRDLVSEARSLGYTIVFDGNALMDAGEGRLLGLFANSGMRDALEEHHGENVSTQPTLAAMTRAALERLDDDPDGFFLMVEGGQIDWAGHDNDPGWVLHELVRFDEAVAEVLAWADGRDDTVVVLTADHETGGLGMSYSRADIPTWPSLAGDGMRGLEHTAQFNFGAPGMLDGIWRQGDRYRDLLGAPQGDEPDLQALQQRIAEGTGVVLGIDELARLLETEPNAWHDPDHEYLDAVALPAFADFEAFYVYADGMRAALLARALSHRTGVVWSNGTHTNVPVPVFVWSPHELPGTPRGIVDHVQVGRFLFDLRGLAP